MTTPNDRLPDPREDDDAAADDPLADGLDDDDEIGLPPAPLDVSARQNLLFIEATAALLGNKAGVTSAEGLKKLEMWHSILEDSTKAGLGKIRQDFRILQEQLASPTPDGHLIALAIASLADETQKVGNATVDKKYEEPLQRLSEALLKLGSSLSK